MTQAQMTRIAALYGCKIIEKYAPGSSELFVEANGKEELICNRYYASGVDASKLVEICKRVSGKSLSQYWSAGA